MPLAQSSFRLGVVGSCELDLPARCGASAHPTAVAASKFRQSRQNTKTHRFCFRRLDTSPDEVGGGRPEAFRRMRGRRPAGATLEESQRPLPLPSELLNVVARPPPNFVRER